MKSFTLEANLKLLSLNRAFIYLRNGSRCRSKDYNEFSLAISRLMFSRRSDFLPFDSYFDYKLHEIHAELEIYTDELYTKEGKLNKKSGDIGNMEKCLTDCVLVGNIDDAAIVKWSLSKSYRPLKGFKLSLQIVDRIPS